ncbi:olfactory receptor 10G6-like [Protobothrops mucrosquamatus]|uniref:olfactory receptor 10G6-like n=1 Tax=Protobothrops mucrosquamatus TaxID=103944 RepID=UPI0010FB2DFB|nr:olfactory receptor 10G6-like [Protobothrops mucrosquamatus]
MCKGTSQFKSRDLRRFGKKPNLDVMILHKLGEFAFNWLKAHSLAGFRETEFLCFSINKFMECPNQTAPNMFILSGFPYPEDLRFPLLLLFSIMFILTLSANALILGMVISDLQLHKPMYWFLGHLSILDMIFTTVVVPKVIAGFTPGGKVISFGGCVSQLFIFHFIGCSECFLYSMMAYDRFLAICKPLHYTNIMNWKTCLFLSLGTVIGGCLNSSFLTSLTFHLPFGEDNHIDYVFCDIPAVLKLACIDIQFNQLMIITDMGFFTMACFLLILASYAYIIIAILKISSSEGRQRAFSTCSAHLMVVLIYYLPIFYHYMRQGSQNSMDIVVSMSYTTITPFLNPVIYTLRNKDIKTALVKLWGMDIVDQIAQTLKMLFKNIEESSFIQMTVNVSNDGAGDLFRRVKKWNHK